MPLSRTATTTPEAPGRPASIRLRQAPTASMPPGETGSRELPVGSGARKFHCLKAQSPDAVEVPAPSSRAPESSGSNGSGAGAEAEAR